MMALLEWGTVAWWVIVETIALRLIAILACIRFAARLYRFSDLLYGQRPVLRRLLELAEMESAFAQEGAVMPAIVLSTPTPLPGEASRINEHVIPEREGTSWQCVRFGLIGCLNASIDLLVLNALRFWRAEECCHQPVLDVPALTTSRHA